MLTIRRVRGTVFVVAAAIVLASTAVHAAGTIDQEQPEHDDYFCLSRNREAAQIFTAGRDGELAQVDLWLRTGDDGPLEMVVQIRPTGTIGNGLHYASLDTVLGEAFVPAADVPEAGGWVEVEFDGVDSVAGTVYAIVAFPRHDMNCRFRPARVGIATDDPYAGGYIAYFRGGIWDTGSDWRFRTYVTPPDDTAPVISAEVVGTQGDNGWYRSDVTVSWHVTDEESPISSSTDGCQPTTITSDTSGITLTCAATSDGGTGSASITVKRDATPPEVDVTGAQDGATYIAGADPEPGCSTTDALSGVAQEASVGVTGVEPDGTGEITATCDGAIDNAGNTGSATVRYSVISPQEAIENLQGEVQAIVDAGELRSGQANGLMKPLRNAIRSLDAEKNAAACSQLADFIVEVEAKTPEPLSQQTADGLVGDADAIRNAIGC